MGRWPHGSRAGRNRSLRLRPQTRFYPEHRRLRRGIFQTLTGRALSTQIMGNKPLNVGLVGGGKGAFIVHPHQRAIHFDGTRRVVAGALFPDPKIALEEAAQWPYPIKGYGSYDEMIAANKTAPADRKLDYILIATPNSVHFDPAMKAMKAGTAEPGLSCPKGITPPKPDGKSHEHKKTHPHNPPRSFGCQRQRGRREIHRSGHQRRCRL